MWRTWLSLFLTVGISFCVSFAVARMREGKSKVEAGAGERPRIDENRSELSKGKATGAGAGQAPGAQGVLRDALLRQALANLDLVAAVKEFLAHEQEDHCVDTRLVCLVENLPAERLGELPGLLDQFANNAFVIKFVLGTWAKRDAAGALEYVQSHGALSKESLHAFLCGWTRGDPQGALAYVEGLPASTKCTQLQTSLIEAMSEKDPAQAFDLMKSKGWLEQNPTAILKLMNNWGGVDPTAALQAWRSVVKELRLDKMPGDVAESATEGDFSGLLSSMLNGAFQLNPAEAVALIEQLSPEEKRRGREAIAQEVLARDPSVVVSMMRGAMDASKLDLLKAVAGKIPTTMLEGLSQVQNPATQKQLLLSLAANGSDSFAKWTVSAGTQQLVSSLLPGLAEDEREMVTAILVRQTGTTQPAWAAELWEMLPNDQQMQSGHAFFQGVATANPEVALNAFQNGSPELQERYLKSLCSGMARTKPQQALELAMMQTDQEIRVDAMTTVYAYWARDQPEAALAELEQKRNQMDAQAMLKHLSQAGNFYGMGEGISTDKLRARLQQISGNNSTPPSNP